MKYILAFFVVCFSFEMVLAQHPITINMAEKDGLPDVEFYDIIRDQKDLFWLAANSGLYRYNGTDFLKVDCKQQKGLSVFNLTEDCANRIWCVNLYGQIMYGQNDSLHIFKDLHQVLKGNLASIFIENNDLIVVWEEGILIFDIKTAAQKFYKKVFKIATQKIQGKIYIFTSNGIVYSLADNHQLVQFYQFDNQEDVKVAAIFFEYKDKVYLSYRENYQRTFIDLTTNTQLNTSEFKELYNLRIIRVKELDNKLWFATNKGVFVYSINKDESWQLSAQYFSDEIVSDIFKDIDENYWFTTLNNGIYVMPNILIGKYKDILLKESVSSLEAVSKNLVAIGTTEGIVYLLNTQTEKVTTIQLPHLKTVNNLFYNEAKEELYISTNSRLSYSYDLKKGKLKSEGNKFGVTKGLAITETDIVYLTYNRAQVYLNTFTNHQKIKPLERKRAYSVLSDLNKNTVYIGYIDELVKYDSLWKPTTLTLKGENIQVSHLAQTENGVIWANINHVGIAAIVGDSILVKYKLDNGLIDNNLSFIKAVGNKLWCSYKGYLQCINTETDKITTITKQDGLENLITGLTISDSLLIFSSRRELYALPIYNELLFKKRKVPEVYFTQILIGNQNENIKDKYILPYEKNSVAFHFQANSFEAAKHLKFKYKLRGFDTQWRTTDHGISSVEYNSLPAGNFTFEIKTTTANNEYTSTGKKIELVIQLPFWEEWWFITLCLSLVFGALIFYYQKKMKSREEKQNQIFDKLVQEKKFTTLKLENLRSQMNPHFIFNALNSIQEYIINNQKNLASSYLVKFSRLIRIYLQHSQVNDVTLSAEIEALSLYLELEKIRFEEELKYHLEIAEGVNTKRIKVPSIFIQPYVENAIKHGLLHKKNNRKLEIKFELSECKTKLLCRIEDNGVGREAAQRISARNSFHTSFATKANEERIDLYNLNRSNKISVEINDIKENNIALGTVVSISIPVKKH
ncbi:sensor histidine kinase [Chondrinema litorale]|uniref:sensor histidine kinase n=1 Tax=Chondrinema litorale TaxID=2994555 RepID=UPI0025438021|nr:histidine kinase [Chondrinema litorale]UZR96463.1 histidine kinase [Chondrinema litorale]